MLHGSNGLSHALDTAVVSFAAALRACELVLVSFTFRKHWKLDGKDTVRRFTGTMLMLLLASGIVDVMLIISDIIRLTVASPDSWLGRRGYFVLFGMIMSLAAIAAAINLAFMWLEFAFATNRLMSVSENISVLRNAFIVCIVIFLLVESASLACYIAEKHDVSSVLSVAVMGTITLIAVASFELGAWKLVKVFLSQAATSESVEKMTIASVKAIEMENMGSSCHTDNDFSVLDTVLRDEAAQSDVHADRSRGSPTGHHRAAIRSLRPAGTAIHFCATLFEEAALTSRESPRRVSASTLGPKPSSERMHAIEPRYKHLQRAKSDLSDASSRHDSPQLFASMGNDVPDFVLDAAPASCKDRKTASTSQLGAGISGTSPARCNPQRQRREWPASPSQSPAVPLGLGAQSASPCNSFGGARGNSSFGISWGHTQRSESSTAGSGESCSKKTSLRWASFDGGECDSIASSSQHVPASPSPAKMRRAPPDCGSEKHASTLRGASSRREGGGVSSSIRSGISSTGSPTRARFSQASTAASALAERLRLRRDEERIRTESLRLRQRAKEIVRTAHVVSVGMFAHFSGYSICRLVEAEESGPAFLVGFLLYHVGLIAGMAVPIELLIRRNLFARIAVLQSRNQRAQPECSPVVRPALSVAELTSNPLRHDPAVSV